MNVWRIKSDLEIKILAPCLTHTRDLKSLSKNSSFTGPKETEQRQKLPTYCSGSIVVLATQQHSPINSGISGITPAPSLCKPL